MAHGGTTHKQTWGKCGFVIFREYRIALGPVKQRGNLFQTSVEPGAKNWGMGRHPLLVFASDHQSSDHQYCDLCAPSYIYPEIG